MQPLASWPADRIKQRPFAAISVGISGASQGLLRYFSLQKGCKAGRKKLSGQGAIGQRSARKNPTGFQQRLGKPLDENEPTVQLRNREKAPDSHGAGSRQQALSPQQAARHLAWVPPRPSKAPAFCSLDFWGEKQPLLGQWRPPSSGFFHSACGTSVLSQLVLSPGDTKARNRLSRTINVRHKGLFNKPHSPAEMKHSGVLHGKLQQGPTAPHAPPKQSPSEQDVAILTLISVPISRLALLHSIRGEAFCLQTRWQLRDAQPRVEARLRCLCQSWYLLLQDASSLHIELF